MHRTNDEEKKQAQKGLLLFLALIAAVSIPLHAILIHSGKQAMDQVVVVVLLM